MAIISITREEGRKEGIGWGGGTTIPREEWRKRGRGLRAISITPEESRKEGIGWGGHNHSPRRVEEEREGFEGYKHHPNYKLLQKGLGYTSFLGNFLNVTMYKIVLLDFNNFTVQYSCNVAI